MKIISHKGARSLWIVGPPLFNTDSQVRVLKMVFLLCGESSWFLRIPFAMNLQLQESQILKMTFIELTERASRHGSFLLVLMSQMSQIRVLNRLLSSVETLVLLQCSSQNKLEFTQFTNPEIPMCNFYQHCKVYPILKCDPNMRIFWVSGFNIRQGRRGGRFKCAECNKTSTNKRYIEIHVGSCIQKVGKRAFTFLCNLLFDMQYFHDLIFYMCVYYFIVTPFL